MSTKPPTFAEAWSRGWRVIFMILVIQFIGWLCSLPLALLPGKLRIIVAIALLFILGPPIHYWGFTLFFPGVQPDPEPATDPEASSCAACGTAIPPGKETCPHCGWTYKST